MVKLNFLLIFVFVCSKLFSQNDSLDIQIKNTKECGFDFIQNQMFNLNPELKFVQEKFEQYINQEQKNNSLNKFSGEVYQIPVVVHVLHKGEAIGTGVNLSEESILLGIKNLNIRWRKIVGTAGDGNGVDMNIEFVLAVRDQNGNCTNGIVRRDMSNNSEYVNSGVNYYSTNGITDAAVKTEFWDTRKYYNIYVVSGFSGSNIAGYAFGASSHGNSKDGTVIASRYFTNGVTLAHELGHAFNLLHTFEGDKDSNNDGRFDTCPSVIDGCGSGIGDCVSDTPPHVRTIDIPGLYSDCSNSSPNPCLTSTTRQAHIRNYMDYTGCDNSFSQGQKDRVLSALNYYRSSYLASNGNLSLVPTTLAMVDFIANSTIICVGGSVTLNDKSSCIPFSISNSPFNSISFEWVITGPEILKSSMQNPTFIFSKVGIYKVMLKVTNSFGSSSRTKESYIYVSQLPTSGIHTCTPKSQNSGSYQLNINSVSLNNLKNSTSSSTNTAYTDFICTKNTFVNEGQSYLLKILARANNARHEYCKVWIDFNNNGEIDSSSINEIVLNSKTDSLGFISALTVDVTIPFSAVKNTLLRMRVYGEASSEPSKSDLDCSSPFYIGDVEDYGLIVVSSDNLSVDELNTFDSDKFYIYPNPVIDYITLSSKVSNSYEARIFDPQGRCIQTTQVYDKIDVNDLKSGVYFLELNNYKSQTIKYKFYKM